MMRWALTGMIGIYFLSTAFGTETGTPSPSRLLQCLAKEEENIHRDKVRGPIVELNREMLSAFAGFDGPFIKKEYLGRICRSPSPFGPSLALLQVILVHGKKAFSSTTKRSSYRKLHQNFLKKLPRKAAKMLIRYLSGIQGMTPKADCLKEAIEPLGKIHQRYKAIEEDVGIEQLISPSDVKQIFAHLKNLDQIAHNCGQKEKSQSLPKTAPPASPNGT
ncbi:MAG: hypothetical protein OXB88_09490 [Bacteriovoracales bacterium]|nr:hypothetical protein [Bacteriovoracales bacterium]